MATNIPPHNLREVVDAVIYRITHQNATIEDLMRFVPAPDFPTGGIIYRSNGIEEMYKTGRGRFEVAAKTEIVDDGKNGKSIIITEIPYDVIKIALVFSLDKLRHDKILPGIQEVRDESDISGIRIVIDLKKDANVDAIYNYLMSKTQLVTGFSANMVAIVNGQPKTM
ncbi:MAG: hypothetical protein J5718_01775, partial [Lachnospiraceae bacterium]|nr:hypothetical protein [Lachnospiraceae bacterium]